MTSKIFWKKIYKKRVVLFFFYILFGILLLTAYFMPKMEFFQIKGLQEVHGEWKYTILEEDTILQAEHLITDEMAGNTMMFHTYDSYVEVYAGEELIYHFGEEPLIGKSPGSYYHFVKIPYRLERNSLSIFIHTVYPRKFQMEYEFYVGNAGEIIVNLVRGEMFGIVTNIIMLMFGVVVCLLHFIESREKLGSGRNLYLGLMILTFVVWLNSSLFFSQILFKNPVFQYYLTYFSLYMLPFLFLLYVESMHPKLHCRVEFSLCLAVICLNCLMHLAGIRDFTENGTLFAATLGVSLTYLLIRIVKNFYQSKTLWLGVFIFSAFVMMNIVVFILRAKFVNHMFFTRVGLICYMLFSVWTGVRQMLQEMALAKETSMLKAIAYEDNLTKSGNRYAFEKELKKAKLEKMAMVSMDLNNLKSCNDNYGHACGDAFIRMAAYFLHEVFGEGVYRIGGDEFVALVENMSESEFFAKRIHLQERLDKYNARKESPVDLEIACGYAAYEEGDLSYEDILKRADAKMYCDKKMLKNREKLS
ncbi:MAG: GGDEF domain-containing protein [Lachnospiraceae bacterium]|nr:GGDEF domain-containing protein [Lachnospiraceae bacterium]